MSGTPVFDPLFDDGVAKPVYKSVADPRQYAMMDLVQTNTAFQNPNAGQFGPIYQEIQETREAAAFQYQNQSMSQSDYQMVDDMMQNTQMQTSLYQQHTDDHITNLPYNLPSAQQAIHIGNNIPDNPISEGCDVINSLYGSVIQGAGLLGQLLHCIRNIRAYVQQLDIVGVLNEIQCIGGFIGQMAGFIVHEIGYLSRVVSLVRVYASAGLYVGLGNDPCARLLFRSIGTPALVNTLGRSSGASGVQFGGTFS